MTVSVECFLLDPGRGGTLQNGIRQMVAQMPAVAYPSPGGLTYTQVTDLIAGVAAKARIAGFCMVEFAPGRDPAGTAAFTAARIACNVIGRISQRAR